MICQATLREFFEQTYSPFCLTGLKETTVEQYRVALNHLERFAARDVAVTELGDQLVSGLMANLFSQGRSPATCNKTRAHLLALWRFARTGPGNHLLTDQPEVRRLKQPRRLPRAWPAEDLQAILNAASKSEGWICAAPASLWWTALVWTLWETGLRIRATMQLQWDGLDRRRMTLFVAAEEQKQYADQLLAISPRLLHQLDAIRRYNWPDQTARGDIFAWPFDKQRKQYRTLGRHYRKLLQRAGMPNTKTDLFHKLRKTNASYMKLGGGDPTFQLGH
ncbi:MAG: site-specific integrase, partial [Acidobacteria bacterium]|nr:site-specific integrase [Acidobacteriota bacterium]